MRLLYRRFYLRRLALLALAVTSFISAVHRLWIDLRTLDLDLFRSPTVPILDDPEGVWSEHPVAVLHRRAEKKFEDFILRQSKTADDAEAEYTRRYGRQPPPGFHHWVEYALKHASPIIDDFDIIAEGVHRHHNLSAAEIERRMHGAVAGNTGMLHNDRVARCRLSAGEFDVGCRHFAKPLTDLLGSARSLAPDVDFLINFLDEPSVLVGNKAVDDAGVPEWENLSHQPLAGALAEACQVRGNITAKQVGGPADMHGLPFVQDIAVAKDLCHHREYNSMHGFLMCPATMKRMKTAVPILSQAAPYPFADILYPSTHYGLKSSLYRQSQDRGWSRKKNAAYWTGSSTGGYWSPETWPRGHRQRLAAIGLTKHDRNYTFLRPSADEGGGVQSYTSAEFDTSLFNVGLTRVVGCTEDAVCDEQRSYFGLPRPLDSELEVYHYRFVLDIDGNSYSGRFYRFLASRSVPLKISIFREWHDERLLPWLHYVPVSPSMEELPELMRFLATTSEGQRISRRIAEAGREWYFKAMTPIHHGIYLYRLVLELAWMQDTTRQG
ncbi:hypothetical protein GE09DRAFT_359522 [Coniochaeta sp. 2T2.1]|nr:hypothetical protein GE09DRAFT_359522 [Coniochaeta sp. 2T2.1]